MSKTSKDIQDEITATAADLAALRNELKFRQDIGDTLARTIAARACGDHGGTCSVFPVIAQGATWTVTVTREHP